MFILYAIILYGDQIVRRSFFMAPNWVILRGGRRYICYRKDETIHGISAKCVAPLVETCPKARYEMQDVARDPSAPPRCASDLQ